MGGSRVVNFTAVIVPRRASRRRGRSAGSSSVARDASHRFTYLQRYKIACSSAGLSEKRGMEVSVILLSGENRWWSKR